MPETRQFILLPREGFIAREPRAQAMLTALPVARSTRAVQTATLDAAGGRGIRIVDTVREDGPKLVELDDEAADRTNAPESPLRAVPVVYYDRPNPQLNASPGVQPAAGLTTVTLQCEDAVTGNPLAGAIAVAFTNFAVRSGDQGTSDASGQVQLRLAGGTIERLYVYPPAGYWGAYRAPLAVSASITIPLDPVDLSFVDAVRRYYGATSFDRTAGVTVGVLDSGVGPHGDLNLVGGRNTVTGEPANLIDDPDSHGTHVAGLIGSDGTPPSGLRGVAPGVQLQGYRVFGQNAGGASNYAILKAMIFAAADGCDIINLSLGGGPFDYIVEEAVQDARNQGMLVVVAAGNDGRKAVNYPGAYRDAIAVSAMGHADTFPTGSLPEADIERPPTSSLDSKEFVAAFSNVGPQIAITGLGVGVLSTLPANAFGPMSGTSMAAPVVAGAVASLLSQDPSILGMARDRARSDAIEMLIQSNCVRRGFGAIYEGYGLPDPNAV